MAKKIRHNNCKVSGFIRSLKEHVTNKETLSVIISLIFTILIEIIRAALTCLKDFDFKLNKEALSVIFSCETLGAPLVDAGLIIGIVWFFAGIIILISQKGDSFRKNTFESILVFVFAIPSIIWYIVNKIVVSNVNNLIGIILGGLLFVALIIYFGPVTQKKGKSDDGSISG